MTVPRYCHGCQQAAKDLEALADASGILDADDGMQLVMRRKNRMRCAQGGKHLREHRFKPDSATHPARTDEGNRHCCD